MATMKSLVGRDKAEALYALKDQLKFAGILNEDPMAMNRTRFEKYLAAKAEAIIIERTNDGDDADAAYQKAGMNLTVLDHKWRKEAKRINEENVIHQPQDMHDAWMNLKEAGLVDDS